MKRIKYSLGLLIMVCLPSGAAVSVSIEPGVVTFGNTVLLRLISTEPGEPKVAPLNQNFEIINQSRRSQLNIINGKQEQKYIWEYQLLPKREGQLKIPSLVVGQQVTSEQVVEVNKANLQNAEYLLLGEVDRTQQYVGGEIIYSLKLLNRVQVGGNVHFPSFEAFEQATLKEQLNYRTVYQNIHYNVIEWRYALVAPKSGTYEVAPARFLGRVRQNGKVIRIASQPITLTISPQPESWPNNAPWLPAKSVKLWEEWDPQAPEWEAGQSVTRKIQLEVDGVLPAQISDIKWQLPEGIKAYSDKAKRTAAHKDNSLRSRFEQTWVLVSDTSRTVIFPEIVVQWWDTEAEQLKEAKLPSRLIQVNSKAKADLEPVPNVVIGGSEVVQSRAGISQKMSVDASMLLYWIWGLLACSGWLCAAMLWWRGYGRVKRERTTEIKSLSRLDALFIELQKAKSQNNAKGLYHAGLRWLNRINNACDASLIAQSRAELELLLVALKRDEAVDLDKAFKALEACRVDFRPTKSSIPELYLGTFKV